MDLPTNDLTGFFFFEVVELKNIPELCHIFGILCYEVDEYSHVIAEELSNISNNCLN